MPWPKTEETLDGIDWSFYNQTGNDMSHPIPATLFAALNPNVELYWFRACWPGGAPDLLYPYHYDEIVKAKKMVAAYLWPNVTQPIATVVKNWKKALGVGEGLTPRVPKLIILDFENPTYSRSDGELTNNLHESLEAARIAFPQSVIGGYGRASWLDEHIKVPLPSGFPWIVAQYPMPYFPKEAKYRQYKTHAELHAHLPIGNSFTPTLGTRLANQNIIGWQCSEYMFLPGWYKRMDGDSYIRAKIEAIYGGTPPPAPPVPLPPDMVTVPLTLPHAMAISLRDKLDGAL